MFLLTEENIDQTQLVAFLPRLRAKHPGTGKIYLLLDNASYNHAHTVAEEARRQHILLDYLPPYSSNLNPLVPEGWQVPPSA